MKTFLIILLVVATGGIALFFIKRSRMSAEEKAERDLLEKAKQYQQQHGGSLDDALKSVAKVACQGVAAYYGVPPQVSGGFCSAIATLGIAALKYVGKEAEEYAAKIGAALYGAVKAVGSAIETGAKAAAQEVAAVASAATKDKSAFTAAVLTGGLSAVIDSNYNYSGESDASLQNIIKSAQQTIKLSNLGGMYASGRPAAEARLKAAQFEVDKRAKAAAAAAATANPLASAPIAIAQTPAQVAAASAGAAAAAAESAAKARAAAAAAPVPPTKTAPVVAPVLTLARTGKAHF